MTYDDAEYRWVAGLLGRRVASLRRARGITQERLAELSGLSRNQVQNIEHSRNNSRDRESGEYGPGNPCLATVVGLARALRVDLHQLVDVAPAIDPTRPEVAG